MNIEQLATLMNQPKAEVARFVDGLQVWFNKGYSLEQSIEKHLAQMTRLAANSHMLPTSLAVDAFHG